MRNDRKGKQSGWGSAIGWIIFILLFAGRPIFQFIQGALGGAVSLPSNLLPIAAGAVVLLVVIVSAVRALAGSSNAGDARLPTGTSPARPINTPMPPFGGQAELPRPLIAPRDPAPGLGSQGRLPQAPRFDPLFNPTILAVGILGLIALGGAGLVVFMMNSP